VPPRYDDRVAQPTFVPVPDTDRVRASIPPPVPLRARSGRPGELRNPTSPSGRGFGTTGPDQGYALTLAHRLAPKLRLADGEDRHDAALGVALLGARRAALAGRAPSIYDLEVAAGLFGFLGDAPADLVSVRRAAFRGVAHSYDAQRALIDAVPEGALRCTPEEALDIAKWTERLGTTREAP
jgi:hypothetical protein